MAGKTLETHRTKWWIQVPGLVMTNIAMVQMAIEIVDLPIENGDFLQLYQITRGYGQMHIVCFVSVQMHVLTPVFKNITRLLYLPGTNKKNKGWYTIEGTLFNLQRRHFSTSYIALFLHAREQRPTLQVNFMANDTPLESRGGDCSHRGLKQNEQVKHIPIPSRCALSITPS